MTRLLIAERKGSVQVEMYAKKQRWGGTAWIYGLWVEPQYRRQGKADELLSMAEYVAAQHGHKSVMLEWKQQDTPVEVLHWYLRRGYKEKRFSGEGDYYLLEKQLQFNMKREIKFRGKSLDSEEWVYGSLIEYPNKATSIYTKLPNNQAGLMFQENRVIPATVGQFTGMKDNAGNDIYEGDIVSYPDLDMGTITTPVVYDAGAMCVEGGSYLLCEYADKCTVVGNIYKNTYSY